ncbi:MAG: DUF6880 family protein [Fibrobacterota bacterium]
MTDRTQQLIDLGPKALAAALEELAEKSHSADAMITRLLSTEKESIARFKRSVAGLKRARKPLWGRGAYQLSQKLEILLRDLRSDVTDPRTGFDLLVRFFQLDQYIFNRCDDSGGFVGDVFRIDAENLFTEYAAACRDKEMVAEVVFDLMQENDFGLRDGLVMTAGTYLPEDNIRTMISQFQEQAERTGDQFKKRRSLRYMEDLATQIADPDLFQRAHLATREEFTESGCIAMARIYQRKKDFGRALTWLEEIPPNTVLSHERDTLLNEIYREQGDTKKLTGLLYAKFKAYYAASTLENLLEVTGQEKRDEYIEKAVEDICNAPVLRMWEIRFLINLGMEQKAEQVLISKNDQINGAFYSELLPIAQSLEEKDCPLGATLLYRQLLISILERGYTKAYSHGVRYLKKLDALAERISDWQGLQSYGAFTVSLIQQHGRKRSFWARYEGRQ